MQAVNQVLCGYIVIPETMDRSLDVTINPIGNRVRSERRVWNNGQQRLKLVRFICQCVLVFFTKRQPEVTSNPIGNCVRPEKYMWINGQ